MARQHSVTVAVDELFSRLESEGGTLTVEDPAPEVRAAWRRAIDAAKRSGRVGEGWHLRHTGRDRGDLVIRLVAGVHEEQHRWAARPTEVVVADVVPPAAEHRLLRSARARCSESGIDAGQLDRAVRILYALISEAEHRELGVDWMEDTSGAALCFTSAGERVELHLYEERERRDVLPEPGPDDGPVYSWQRIRTEVREVGTGRLAVELNEDYRNLQNRRRRWADRRRWRLEDKLGDVLAEVQTRLSILADRTRERQHEAARRQQAWEAAIQHAREAFQEARRVEELQRQLADWDTARRIRDYCTALENVGDPLTEAQRAWVAWARSYADRIDPCRRNIAGPEEVEPKAEELRQYLRGWSPYGPESR